MPIARVMLRNRTKEALSQRISGEIKNMLPSGVSMQAPSSISVWTRGVIPSITDTSRVMRKFRREKIGVEEGDFRQVPLSSLSSDSSSSSSLVYIRVFTKRTNVTTAESSPGTRRTINGAPIEKSGAKIKVLICGSARIMPSLFSTD